jgi:hypothetical protein
VTLPFSRSEFLAVFAAYNEAVWPLQLLFFAAGLVAIGLLLFRPPWADRANSAILAAFWLTMAIGYHWTFFAPVNPAAYVFGGIFLLQAGLFVAEGLVRNRIHYGGASGISAWIAALLIAYGVAIYPLICLLVTHPYPTTPLFGIAPCPTTLYTIGFLILARYPKPLLLAFIPLAWSVVGGSAAILLGVPEDWMLFGALLAWAALAFRKSAA